MIRFLAGLIVGLLLVSAVADTREIDCPPGGKIIITIGGWGGGGDYVRR